jgi:hypothetical protein
VSFSRDSLFDQVLDEALALDEVARAMERADTRSDSTREKLRQRRVRLLHPLEGEFAELEALDGRLTFVAQSIRNVVDPFWRHYTKGRSQTRPFDPISDILGPIWGVLWSWVGEGIFRLWIWLAWPLFVVYHVVLAAVLFGPGILAWRNTINLWWAVVPTAFVVLNLLVLISGLYSRALYNKDRSAQPALWLDRQGIDAGVDKIIEQDPDYREIASRMEESLLAVRRRLLEQQVLPEIRTILNVRLAAEDGSAVDPAEFRVVSAAGLGEVDDQRYEISTNSMTRLVRLLRQLPGGSVGLSGPRGVGKTTSLRAIARGDEMVWPEPVLKIYLSAPVRYVALEFLHHIVSEVCTAIAGPPAPAVAPAASIAEISQSARGRLRRIGASTAAWRAVAYLLVFAILVGGYLGARLSGVEAVRSGRTQLIIVAAAALLALTMQAVPLRGLPNLLIVGRQLHVHIALATGTLIGWALLTYGAVVWTIRAPLAAWGGATVAAIALLVIAVDRHRRTRRPVEPLTPETPPVGEPPAPLEALRTEAEELLNAIAYSYSESRARGAKVNAGSKAPIALSGEFSQLDSTTVERRMLTLPQIVARLRALIERATSRVRVLVAIDEIDKIDSKDDARLFINDLKAIFGVYRSYFVVAVSRDAMIDFERRGLAVRTEIDSAFDEVLHVSAMSLDETRELLNRRVVGLTEPYVRLCYCLSGGLPRDAIRAMRAIVNAGLERRGRVLLPEIARSVLIDEASRFATATLAAASNESTWPPELYVTLGDLRRRDIGPEAYESRSSALPVPGESVGPLLETAVLLRFYGAVWHTFGVPPAGLPATDIERLAEARRDMAENIGSVVFPVAHAEPAGAKAKVPRRRPPVRPNGTGVT